MPIDRGYSGSDHPPDDDAQRPRDNRPLDFTRPTYRPRHDLPDPREAYGELFDEPDEAAEVKERASDGEGTVSAPEKRADELELTKPDKSDPVVDAPEQRPPEPVAARDRPRDQPDRVDQSEQQDRLPATTQPTDLPSRRHDHDRTNEPTVARLVDGTRGWWRPDQPDTTDQQAGRSHNPPAPTASPFNGPTASSVGRSAHTEQSEDRLEPARQQTPEERLESYRDGSWHQSGDIRYFPGWGGPTKETAGGADQGASGGSGTSFVFGKVFETRRGMEGLAEAKRDDTRTEQTVGDQATKPDARQDGQPEQPRPWQTIAEETGEVKSFHSYRAAKRELGTVGGTEIHHVVEQSQAKPERSDFDIERINTTDNLTRIPIEVHRQISAHFSSKLDPLAGTVRDTLNGEPWDDQYEYGCAILDEYMREDDDDRA